jgi:hypothetical protein
VREANVDARSHSRKLMKLVTTRWVLIVVLWPCIAAGQNPSILPVDIEVPFVSPPVSGGGASNLVYEIHLRNFWRKDIILKSVDVIDQKTGGVARSISGDELYKSLYKPKRPDDSSDANLLECGRVLVFYVWLTFEPSQDLPDRLYHRLVFSVAGSEMQDERSVDGGVITIPKTDPVKIAPPFANGFWLFGSGPSNRSEHRRTVLAVDGRTWLLQRFAFDAMKVGDDGRVVGGDLASTNNWRSYGQDLLAVADGVVALVVDDIPDNIPLSGERAVPMNRETHVGNCIVLDIGENRFVLYGHLKKGSMPFNVGDRVKRGAVIGKVGNSGNSEAPHLHFSIGTRPDPYSAEGLPFVFDSFELVDIENPGDEALLSTGFGAASITEAPRTRHENEMPVGDPLLRIVSRKE